MSQIEFKRLRIGATSALIASLVASLVSCSSGNKEPMPAGEAQFIKTVNSFISGYNTAVNPLTKSSLRGTRGDELRKIISDMNFAGWVGTVQDLSLIHI